MPVAITFFVLDLPKLVTVPRILRGMVVLEGCLQPMPVRRCLTGALGGCGHDDVRMAVAIVAVSPVGMLDHLDEAVPVGRRVEGVTVEVLVIVAVRHPPILGGGPALTASDDRSTPAT